MCCLITLKEGLVIWADLDLEFGWARERNLEPVPESLVEINGPFQEPQRAWN